MNIIKHILPCCLAALALASCTTSKEIVYLQDIDQVTLDKIHSAYEPKIKEDDLLSIVVSGPDKQVVMPYNLTLSEMTTSSSGTNPENSTLSYLVDSEGCINFPVLGRIHVEGMTRPELVKKLTDEIRKDVKDPIVYVSFKNFKVTVLGEVRNPGTFTMDSQKVTLFQALGRAGDLQLTAKREDIILIREVDGKPTYNKIDLKSAEILNSDFFYLQQNDVLYIPPSATRVATATTATGIWSVMLSSVTALTTVIALIVNLSK